MSQERETTVAEVMFSDEPDAKRAAVATEEGTPVKAISKHPLKNIERGNSVLKLCTYKGAFRRFADPRPTRRVPSRALAARDATMRDSHVRARRFLHAPFSTCSSRAIPRLLRRVFPGDRARCVARPARRWRRLNADRIFPTRSLTAPVHPAAGDFSPDLLEHEPEGMERTLEFRIKFTHKDKKISPWHDIPYRASPDTFHMMCEIPKWTRAKYEIATKEPGNPIKQDEKKGVLREYKHGDMLFNYGFMPQTWEDPEHVSKDAGFKGDDDPLDMVEIGLPTDEDGAGGRGQGAGRARDDRRRRDGLEGVLHSRGRSPRGVHQRRRRHRPRAPRSLDTMREWFREYKVAEGSP